MASEQLADAAYRGWYRDRDYWPDQAKWRLSATAHLGFCVEEMNNRNTRAFVSSIPVKSFEECIKNGGLVPCEPPLVYYLLPNLSPSPL